MTVDELSKFISVPKKTIRDWIYKNKIPYYKVGNHIRFFEKDLAEWLENGSNDNGSLKSEQPNTQYET